MRILATVILYNPDLQLLHANLSAFIDKVENIYVWDNSPAPMAEATKKWLTAKFPDAIIRGDGANHGIAYGLNKGLLYASENDFDALLTMDQDSVFEDFSTYRSRVEKKWKDQGICLCGPTPNLSKEQRSKRFLAVNHLITSGMIVPMEALRQHGGYNEHFFVDGIDVEFCMRMRQKGIRAYEDMYSLLVQRFGVPTERKFLGLTFRGHGYSPQRLHAIFRNHLLIWRHFGHLPIFMLHLIRYYLLSMGLGVLFAENHKREKLNAIFHGILDGLTIPTHEYWANLE